METSVLPGAQERQRRAGTENVAGAVGLAAAFASAAEESKRPAENDRLTGLRDALIGGLMRIPGVSRTGHPQLRLPNSASVVIDGIDGGDLVAALDLEGIEASTGSACTTGSVEPSHVLLAMGIDPERARGSLRLTLGRENTTPDVEATIEAVTRCVARLRAASAEPEPAEAPAAMSGAPSV